MGRKNITEKTNRNEVLRFRDPLGYKSNPLDFKLSEKINFKIKKYNKISEKPKNTIIHRKGKKYLGTLTIFECWKNFNH